MNSNHLGFQYRSSFAILLLFLVSTACAVVPPVTRLPSHIKRIYIREFKNNSRYFGAQADLTLYVNDEFMLDGRLDVVQNERADGSGTEGRLMFGSLTL